jgi:hypothetical protein
MTSYLAFCEVPYEPGRPKRPTAISGPSGFTHKPIEKASVIPDWLENRSHLRARVTNVINGVWKL